VEVKIGVQNAVREIVLDSAQSADEVAKVVTSALNSSTGVLALVDEKGRQVIVPIDKLAYVEIGEPEARRVGFGAL
jgi:hypothetical protein